MVRVAVLGAGHMGTAVVKRLLSLQYEVHVWNRTFAKAQVLNEDGATVHSEVRSALQNSDVVVLLLFDHAVANKVLKDQVDVFKGKDVVDFMTGGSEQARNLAKHLQSAGATYLDAVIENHPGDIGTTKALIYVSCNEEAWLRRRPLIQALAPAAHYLGTRLGAAAEVDAALAGAFSTVAMGAWLEALAFLSDAGIDLKDPAFNLDWWVKQLQHDMAMAVQEVSTGDFSTTEATLAINTAAVEQWREVVVSRGHRANIMSAALENLRLAMGAGLGEKSWSAQVQVLRVQKRD